MQGTDAGSGSVNESADGHEAMPVVLLPAVPQARLLTVTRLAAAAGLLAVAGLLTVTLRQSSAETAPSQAREPIAEPAPA